MSRPNLGGPCSSRPVLVPFIGDRDSFYWATTGSTGWPYVQHRGGPKGFVKVIDDRTLALGDYRGNKQYISTGNLLSDNRVAMIMVGQIQDVVHATEERFRVLERENAPLRFGSGDATTNADMMSSSNVNIQS